MKSVRTMLPLKRFVLNEDDTVFSDVDAMLNNDTTTEQTKESATDDTEADRRMQGGWVWTD
jgi:hypothetical protein